MLLIISAIVILLMFIQKQTISMRFKSRSNLSRFIFQLMFALTVIRVVSGLQKNIQPRQHTISDVFDSPNIRKLQSDVTHGFRIQFSLFRFDTPTQDFIQADPANFAPISNLLMIGAKYFEKVLKVTDLMTSADTVYPVSARAPVSVPQIFKTTGFDPKIKDSIVFVGLLNDPASGLESYSYPIVLKRWPIYSYMRLNIAYMTKLSNTKGQNYEANLAKIMRSLLNILGGSPYYFYNFNFEDILPFYKSYESNVRMTTEEMVLTKVIGGKQRMFIITPKLKEQVGKHFNCPLNYGALVEDTPMAKDIFMKYGYALILDRDVFGNQIMTMSTTIPILLPDSSKTHRLTKISLALLKDTGFYHTVQDVDVPKIKFGKGLGCLFSIGIFDQREQKYVPYVPKVPQTPYVPPTPSGPKIKVPYCKGYASGTQECNQCNENYYLSEKKCVVCSSLIPYCSNCFENYGQIKCQSCDQGWFLSVDKSTCWDCTQLIPYCSTCSDNGDTIKCKVCDQSNGWYLLNGACKSCSNVIPYCSSCLTNYGATECSKCDIGYYSASKNTCANCSQAIPYCQSCSLVGTKVNCIKCSDNYLLNSDKNCVLCSQAFPYCDSCQSNSGVLSCSKCSANYFMVNGQCVICSIAIPSCKTCVDNLGTVQCSKCADGIVLQNNSCVSCSTAVPYCLTCSSTEAGKCSACDTKAKWYLNSDKKCVLCQKAIKGCQTCIDNRGVTQCSNCAVGFIYQDTQSCTPCSSSIPYCLQCFVTPTAVECDLCDDSLGYFQTKNSLCALCTAVIPNCNTCTDNYGVTECRDCAVGYYSSNDYMKCLKCGVVISNCAKCTKKGLVIQCSSCNDGFIKDSNKCVKV